MDTNQKNPYGQEQQNNYYQNNIPQGNPYGQSPEGANPYQQPYIPPYVQPKPDDTVSILDWVGTVLLMMVPCVGIIVYIVWAFSKDTKPSKANYCKAILIIYLALIVLYLVIIIAIVAIGIGSSVGYR